MQANRGGLKQFYRKKSARKLGGGELPSGAGWTPTWTARDDDSLATGFSISSGRFDQGRPVLSVPSGGTSRKLASDDEFIEEVVEYMTIHDRPRTESEVRRRIDALRGVYGDKPEGFVEFRKAAAAKAKEMSKESPKVAEPEELPAPPAPASRAAAPKSKAKPVPEPAPEPAPEPEAEPAAEPERATPASRRRAKAAEPATKRSRKASGARAAESEPAPSAAPASARTSARGSARASARSAVIAETAAGA